MPKTHISIIQNGSVVRLENGLTGVYDAKNKQIICYEGATGNGDLRIDVKGNECFTILRTPIQAGYFESMRINTEILENKKK